MEARIQLRRDTAANWTSEDPVLASGEIGVETDTNNIKIGDGATAWTSLAYFGGALDINGLPEKTTIADADEFVQADSEDGYALKKSLGRTISDKAFTDSLAERVELNNSFDSSAAGWTLGAGWAWESDGAGGGWVRHTAGNTDPLSFPGDLVDNASYWLLLAVGGTVGTVNVGVDDDANEIAAGSGSVQVTGLKTGAFSTIIYIVPSNDFDGYVDDVFVVRPWLVQDVIDDGLIHGRQTSTWVPLGTAAIADIGTGSGDVAEGDHTHAGGSAHTIQDEGTPLTARANLNFVGGGVTATDDAGNDATVVTIPPNLTTEEVEDIVGAMVAGNTETGIAVTYDDTGGKLNFDAQTAGDARYAPIAKGVTNGDSHDHSGGDGAQIAYTSLSGALTQVAGTWNPTGVAVANVDAIIDHTAQYFRIGNLVHCSGRIEVDPTVTATTTRLRIDLPVASNFANVDECVGTVGDGAGGVGIVQADITNNEAEIRFTSATATNRSFYYIFTYQII